LSTTATTTTRKRAAVSYVAHFDLGREAELILSRPVAELQAERAPASASGTVDASRVLVTCPLGQLEERGEALKRILLSPAVRHALVVLRGRTDTSRSDGAVLSALPRLLTGRSCRTLWVPDARGTVWAVGQGRAQALAVYAADPQGEGAFAALLECLSVPEVHDAVFDQTQPDAVYVPALRMIVPGAGDQDLVTSVERSARESLAGSLALELVSESSEAAVSALGRLHPALLGRAEERDVFARKGRLDLLRTEAEEARDRAIDEAGLLVARPRGQQLERARSAREQAGQALRALRNALVELFQAIDGSQGLDASEQAVLRSAGLDELALAVLAGGKGSSGVQEETLREAAGAELRRTHSLAQVAGELRVLALHSRPRTSTETLDELEQACPEAFVDRLSQRTPLRFVADLRSNACLAGFCASFLWWPGVFRLLPLALIAALAGYLSHLGAEPDAQGEGLSRGEDILFRLRAVPYKPGFAGRLASVIIGLIVGVVVLGFAYSTALWIAGVFLSLIFLAGYAYWTWRVSAAAWAIDAELPALTPALDETSKVTRGVAINDWLYANERDHIARSASRLADGLELVRSMLGEEGTDAPAEADRLACNPAIRLELAGADGLYRESARLEELILEDHLDAIDSVVEATWPLLTSRAGEKGSEAIEARMREWRSAYHAELALHGLFGERPDGQSALSGAGRERRAALLEQLWSTAELENTLSPDGGEPIQLCGADDLPLLDQEPSGFRVVAFAPAVSGEHSGLVQTASRRAAGLVRLVSLRPGTASYDD